ncbi:hypothetical protein IFM89_028970 [Coptis chinensis]|uniref:Uncharacterized protein n=1 Tax=Coptis chinensis TaxID=261450 RepID=A0A835M734_9MAGN|nr:hypothetical protein IFM89_028970 [Coptis chinensis]
MRSRLWWPKQFSSSSSSSDFVILFGWFLPSSTCSLDIVIVPIVASPNKLSNQPDLQGYLRCTNGKMAQLLQDKATFSILGYCTSESSGLCEEWSCGCHKLDGFLEEHRRLAVKSGNWIQLSCQILSCTCKGIRWTPRLHHIHWGGQLVPSSDVYVIIYEPPTFGSRHFSLKSLGSTEQVRQHFKSPMWIDALYKKQPPPDLDTVIFAVNSATSAKIEFEACLSPKNYSHQFSSIFVLVSITCHFTALFLASFFTIIYSILQFFHRLLCYGSQASLCAVIEKVFSHTWENIYIRSCQLLYGPIRLQDSGFRSQSNVEYAHRASLLRHSMWSSVAVDILLGNAVGFTLLLHADTACSWVLALLHDITNSWLRSGCVWLMGVPAGFKLNTELAGILGVISLNAIQIWSTLWIYVAFLFRYFITGLALSGIIFGLTVPAALIVDMIMLATSHVSTLHRLISLIYSHQMKSLAALWRLFRGRKWNPLRQRFDSYDYTVKQHVVGSLLFTPLLLLLPTTSVFYIFFTILKTAISFICILIEVTISILHATPYHELFLWVVRPGRFPSGIWFDIKSCRSSKAVLGSAVVGCCNENILPRILQHRKMEEENNEGAHVLLMSFQTNTASIVVEPARKVDALEMLPCKLFIVLPPDFMITIVVCFTHMKMCFRTNHLTTLQSSVFWRFCVVWYFISLWDSHGQSLVNSYFRVEAGLRTGLPSTVPWMFITYKDYWCLCFDSVLSCLGRSKH